MGISGGAQIVKPGLVLSLDAGDRLSYPGSGTTWSDTSGNGYDFTISASAYITGSIPHMNFEGSYGCAKRVVGASLSDVPNFSNATIMCFSSILNSTSNWRILTRGAASNHPVIIQTGTNNLGMFYNGGGGIFYGASFDVSSSLPNPYTQFNCLTWKLSQSSPYYQFQFNDNSTVYSITNANATFSNGFSSIGAYHNATTSAIDASQYWGKVASFLYYNRHLTTTEILQNYRAMKARFGI